MLRTVIHRDDFFSGWLLQSERRSAVNLQMKSEFCIKTEPDVELINGTLLPSPEPRRTPQTGQIA
jgi:hypothetical protein